MAFLVTLPASCQFYYLVLILHISLPEMPFLSSPYKLSIDTLMSDLIKLLNYLLQSTCGTEHIYFIFIVILLVYWGYIVTFTKVLTVTHLRDY
jgi:hypothetical protein